MTPPRTPSPGDCCEAIDVSDEIIHPSGASPIPLRIYRRRKSRLPAPVVLYFHGGAFTCGSAAGASPLATALYAAGAVVIAVEYPLAPAHPFPQAIDAGYAALSWAQQQRVALTGCRSALVVAGEEAGGNLAAAVALMARDRLQPKLAGTVLLCPMLDPCVGTASLRHSKAGPVGCKWADGWAQYLQNPADADHPYAVPALASRQSGLPPTLLLTAQDDPLRDETQAYARRLRASGVQVEEAVLPAPTGWPETLAQAIPSDAAWRGAMNERLRSFLAALQAPPCAPA